jgi:hypothetical protein
LQRYPEIGVLAKSKIKLGVSHTIQFIILVA